MAKKQQEKKEHMHSHKDIESYSHLITNKILNKKGKVQILEISGVKFYANKQKNKKRKALKKYDKRNKEQKEIKIGLNNIDKIFTYYNKFVNKDRIIEFIYKKALNSYNIKDRQMCKDFVNTIFSECYLKLKRKLIFLNEISKKNRYIYFYPSQLFNYISTVAFSFNVYYKIYFGINKSKNCISFDEFLVNSQYESKDDYNNINLTSQEEKNSKKDNTIYTSKNNLYNDKNNVYNTITNFNLFKKTNEDLLYPKQWPVLKNILYKLSGLDYDNSKRMQKSEKELIIYCKKNKVLYKKFQELIIND